MDFGEDVVIDQRVSVQVGAFGSLEFVALDFPYFPKPGNNTFSMTDHDRDSV